MEGISSNGNMSSRRDQARTCPTPNVPVVLNFLSLRFGEGDEQQLHDQYPDEHDTGLRHDKLPHCFCLFLGLGKIGILEFMLNLHVEIIEHIGDRFSESHPVAGAYICKGLFLLTVVDLPCEPTFAINEFIQTPSENLDASLKRRHINR